MGGFKIVYDYANRLVRDGHEVSLLYQNKIAFRKRKWIPHPAQILIAEVMTQVEPTWYHLDKRVRQISSLNPRLRQLVEGMDVVFATAVETVFNTIRYFPDAKQCYLVQDYENWGRFSEAYLKATYRTDTTKIVISKWLEEFVNQYSPKKAVLIKNPIDVTVYKENCPVESRQKHSIGLLYHILPHKGTDTALKTVKQLKEIYPDLTVKMFGGYPVEEELPDWIQYTRNASQAETVEIYNQVQVFLCASRKEGFGLTGFEAIACGCALVSTDYQGVHEYAEDGENALLAPVDDVEGLVRCVRSLYENPEEMKRLSIKGRESVQQYSWDHAMEKLYSEVLSDR